MERIPGITTGEFTDSANLGANPVATADGLCDAGYRAMFVVPGQRVATTEPYGTEGSLDWVLQPFTAYVNPEGQLMWTTDATPLLGVRDGVQEDLAVEVWEPEGAFIFDYQIITGLNDDWTAANSNTCNGWSTDSEALSARFGDPSSASMPDLITSFQGACASWSQQLDPPLFGFVNSTTVYCVEQ